MLYLKIESRLKKTIKNLLPDADLSLISLNPCKDTRFGDYQTPGLITLAKQRKINPRQLALQVLDSLSLQDLFVQAEIAGPGFLNFKLLPKAIGKAVFEACKEQHPFINQTETPSTIVIDFGSPNVAKPMHVGHIRSTILGACLVKLHRLLGNRVISDNHIGDWGTQFGKLILGWKTALDKKALAEDPIKELERLYKLINAASEEKEVVLESARQELVKLQKGDPENLEIWKQMIQLSQSQFNMIYDRLNVKFDYTLGESFYNNRLKGIVSELVEKRIAEESQGAYAVFFKEDPELKEHPAIIQKRDGAANYATTDLATLEYRMKTWNPNQIIYVTDGRQQLHFKQVFSIFKRWKGSSPIKLTHVWFGTILGENGKPFKTRSGEVIKLVDLLDEAEERALAVVQEKNPNLPLEIQKNIARVVGIGAIKYADLLPNRQSDYMFNWNKMLAFNGNTAPYLLYAYTRIQSIFRKYEKEKSKAFDISQISEEDIFYQETYEFALAKHLFSFGLVLQQAADDSRPNILCNYVYELAGLFASFYEHCPVLKSEGSEQISRLALCHVTARVLKIGLQTLGLETLEEM